MIFMVYQSPAQTYFSQKDIIGSGTEVGGTHHIYIQKKGSLARAKNEGIHRLLEEPGIPIGTKKCVKPMVLSGQ